MGKTLFIYTCLRDLVKNDFKSLKNGNLLGSHRILFTGIKETETLQMDCEKVLKDFINTELKLNSDTIEFERIHRIGKRNPQEARPRPIVARFSRFKDRESVRQAAPRELRGKPYGVNEQFPRDVAERRKRLIPAFRKSRKDSTIRSSLIADKLYINGRQLTEDEAIAYADDGTPGPSQHPGNRYHRASPVNRQQNASRLSPNRVTNVNNMSHAHSLTTTQNRFSALNNSSDQHTSA